MSSLTDVAREPFSTARHASRRANLAPYVSASFAVLAVAIFILFAYQAGFFGERQELQWRDDAELGMGPTQQAFDGDDLAASQIELWLVVQHELVFVDRCLQFVE